MNKYNDEEVVKLLNEHKKHPVGDVYSGIKINGDLYHFHEYHFLDDQLTMMLPLRFVYMPSEIAKVKYGHVAKPDVLICSRDYNIDVMLYFTEEELHEDNIEDVLDEQVKLIKEIQPGYEIYEKAIEDNGFIKVGWLDFRASAIDIGIYSVFFVFPINGKKVLGKFTCNIYRADVWKPVVMQILYSINNKERIVKNVKHG